MARSRKASADDPARTVALIYIRVSKSDEERDRKKGREPDRHQVSPETQLERCKALPALQGLAVETFQDLDFSGWKAKHPPAFERMMERAVHGDVAVVAVYKIDRLSRRSIGDFDATLKKLKKAGVRIVSATEQIDTSNAMGEFFLYLLGLMAKLFSDVLSERVEDAMATKKAAGWVGGRAPVGYRREGKALVLDEEWAPIVRQVFELYADGEGSFEVLARRLNRQRVPNPKGSWHSGHLQALMKNVTYLGKNKEDLEAHPALITKKLWDQVQAVRTLNQRRKSVYRGIRPKHALSGLARCARCGGALHYRGPTKRGPAFYLCANQNRGGTCDLPWLPGATLEGAVRESLAFLAQPDKVDPDAARRLAAGLRRAADPRAMVRAELKALDERARRLNRAYELDPDMGDEEYDRGIRAINLAKVAAREKLTKAPELDVAFGRERLTSLLAAWTVADGPERNHLLNEVVDSVEVDRLGGGGAKVTGRQRDPGVMVATVVPRVAWVGFFGQVVGTKLGKPSAYVNVVAGKAVTQARPSGGLSAIRGEAITLAYRPC